MVPASRSSIRDEVGILRYLKVRFHRVGVQDELMDTTVSRVMDRSPEDGRKPTILLGTHVPSSTSPVLSGPPTLH